MSRSTAIAAYLCANVVAVMVLLGAWRAPALGRFLLSAVFGVAACINLWLALTRPSVYLGYADVAFPGLYRDFILGWFERHAGGFVLAIAAGQIAIAIAVAMRGVVAEVGLTGALIFLISIAPLGAGAAFPASLLLGAAVALLLCTFHEQSVAAELAHRARSRA